MDGGGRAHKLLSQNLVSKTGNTKHDDSIFKKVLLQNNSYKKMTIAWKLICDVIQEMELYPLYKNKDDHKQNEVDR